jgi:hypothetical protein
MTGSCMLGPQRVVRHARATVRPHATTGLFQ